MKWGQQSLHPYLRSIMGRLLKRRPSVKKKKTQSRDKGESSNNGAATSRRNIVPASIESNTDDPKKGRSRGASAKTILNPVKKSPSGPIGGYVGKAIQFLREVKAELKKVTWPSRKQTIGSTLVVLVLVMIISLFLGLVDFCLSGLIRMIL